VLEYDHAAVVDAITNRNQKLLLLWRTYEEIEAFQGALGGFKIGKIIRESNQAAHELAKLAKYSVFNSF
jgi:hypothetical protein